MLNAVIIDDEEDARIILSILLKENCPNVNVIATSSSIIEGEEAIKRHKPDLVFLDIEMPNGSGFDLLEKFSDANFAVIFVTAYENYALRAIKCSAVDYILKPIIVDELIAAVKKVKPIELHLNYRLQTLLRNREKLKRIALPVQEGHIVRELSSILYCRADSNYTTFHFPDNEKIMVSKTLKDFEYILEGNDFYRIHDSHIINLSYIQKYIPKESMVIMKDGTSLLISRRRKAAFLEVIPRAGGNL